MNVASARASAAPMPSAGIAPRGLAIHVAIAELLMRARA
jgi:hypothetical protein